MFRVRAQIDRELLARHLQQVKTGLPGVAWVKLDAERALARHACNPSVPAASAMAHDSIVVRLDRCRACAMATRSALAGITLDIPAGRMVGLIGPDGVGKSSLLALIAGARVIQHGQVEVLGGDMAQRRHRNAICPRIAYMPQGLGKNLLPHPVGGGKPAVLRPPVRPRRGRAPPRASTT